MKNKVKHLVAENKSLRKIAGWSDKVVLPGFDKLTLFEVLAFVLNSFKKARYGIRSSAISFRFFLALFPTIIFFLSLIPYIPIENFQDDVLYMLSHALPNEIYELLRTTIDDLILHKHGIVLSVGFLLSIFFASSGINTVLTAFNYSYQLELRASPFKTRIASLGIFLIITTLFTVAFSITMIGAYFVEELDMEHLGVVVYILFAVVKWIIAAFSFMLAISILYNAGNLERKKWKLFSPGATLATVVIIIASFGLELFFENFAQYNQLYGSMGSLIMVLIWINVVSYILLIGFELSTAVEAKKIRRYKYADNQFVVKEGPGGEKTDS